MISYHLLHELGRQAEQPRGLGVAAAAAATATALALEVELKRHLTGLHHGGLLARVARDLAFRGLLVEELFWR